MKNLIIFLFTLFFSCTSNEKNSCSISGELVGCDYKTLILFRSHQDPKYSGEKILIDEKHSFHHKIVNPLEERYSLISEEDFNKNNFSAYPIDFFADSKSIEFKIHPINQMTKNEIHGSKLSSKLLLFEIKEKKWLDSIQIKEHQISNVYSLDQMEKKQKHNDSITKVFISNKLKYIQENQNIIGYSILIQLIQSADGNPFLNKNELIQTALAFRKKLPDLPYSKIESIFNPIKVGGNYTNFIAPNYEGRPIEISEIVKKHKITLIDLWAPWCGPCIEKGRELIPLYNKYKESGFEIIGVVGGIKDIESYKKAVMEQNYPWPNLSEINNEKDIWEKYNIMGAGGRMFLVNNKGIIVAIDPSLQEIEKIIR